MHAVKKGEQQEVLLNIPALPVGKHHGRIRIISDDAMPLDNTRYFSLNVLPPSNVLLVSNTPAASKVVANAIGVSSSLGTGSEYVTDLISYQDLPIVRMSQYEVVVLIDPPSNRQVNGLCDAYLKNGGQMLVSLGSRITMESDNSLGYRPKQYDGVVPNLGPFFNRSIFSIQHFVLLQKTYPGEIIGSNNTGN